MLGIGLANGCLEGVPGFYLKKILCLKDHDDHRELCMTEIGVESDRIALPLD